MDIDKDLFNSAVMMYSIYQWDEKIQKSENVEGATISALCDYFRCEWNVATLLYNMAKEAIEENTPRREFVTSFMHYTGENYGTLDNKQMWEVYCAADGYGVQPASRLRRINGGWDWSHIRDSTIDGWKRMEKRLNSFGIKRED